MNATYPTYKHILTSEQFDKKFLKEILELTDAIRLNPVKFSKELQNRIVALVFFETSTRTRMSFESAVARLGGTKIHTENAVEFSSAAKGETLEDTISTISSYVDFIILRHSEDNSSERAAQVSSVPVINAGSGVLHHPTQALLDFYTIYKEKGRVEGLNITLVGDLARGRTCDSLVFLLSKYPNNKFTFVAPESCQVKKTLTKYLSEQNVEWREMTDLESALEESDVVYMTRIQKERFHDLLEYERDKGKYQLNKTVVSALPAESIIMHPLPRVDEISVELDSDPRAKYFDQVRNGLFVRMALFKILNDKIYGMA